MGQKIKILLIEDAKNIVFVEKLCLESNDYAVFVAEDGIQGLESAINLIPDLILLDIKVPKMNGYLVLEALQNNEVTKKIPVLITSAKAQVDDLKQAFNYKIQGYLVKPFAPRELLEKVAEVLREKGSAQNG